VESYTSVYGNAFLLLAFIVYVLWTHHRNLEHVLVERLRTPPPRKATARSLSWDGQKLMADIRLEEHRQTLSSLVNRQPGNGWCYLQEEKLFLLSEAIGRRLELPRLEFIPAARLAKRLRRAPYRDLFRNWIASLERTPS